MIRACPVHKTKYCIMWVHIPDPQHFGNVGQQLRPNHFGPFLIALTESWKEDCKCYGSLMDNWTVFEIEADASLGAKPNETEMS